MPPVAVAVAATYAGTAAATALGLSAATSAFAFAVVSAAASFTVATIGNKLFSDSTGKGGTSAGVNTSVRQPAAARRLIYGEVKAGGILVYPGQTLDGDAHLVLAICEGEIDSISPVYWLAEDLSSEGKFDGLLSMEAFTGTPDQAACASLVAALPGEWTTDHRLRGVAYAYVRMKFDRNVFSRGLVFPTFKVRGRKIFDPRTNVTAWSDNPALALLDYLRSKYSVQAADDLIDFESFMAAANVCDEVIYSVDPANVVNGVPNRVKRYTLNGVFETSSGPVPVLETMEAACGGKLVFTQGKYRFYAGAYRAPSGTITSEFLRAAPTYRTHPGRQQRANIARGTYREPRQDWQDTSIPERRLSEAVIAEAGEIVQTYSYPATTVGAVAQRLTKLALMKARGQVPLVLNCNWAPIEWRLWDTVTVDMPEINVAGRTFCITEYTFVQGGGIDLTLVPDDAAFYAWDAATDELAVKDAPVPNFNSTPPAVTGLVVIGTAINTETDAYRTALQAGWDATTDPFFDHYEVQIKDSTEPSYEVPIDSANVSLPTYTSPSAIVAGLEYDFRVRVVRGDGSVSEWTEVENTLVQGDTTPPMPPTDLSVTGTGALTIRWRTPANADFRKSSVYRNSSNTTVGAMLLQTVVGLPDTVASIGHTVTATTYYWVSALDASGNESELVPAGSGT